LCSFCDCFTILTPSETTTGVLNSIGLTREELSQMTGTSLFTVSRLLSLWGELDILTVDRKTVVIEDLPRLLWIAETQRTEFEPELLAAGARG
jgi:hypothetical protein